MIKDLTAVTVVLIIVLGVLLYVWTDRRRTTRKSTLQDAQARLGAAVKALDGIQQELDSLNMAGKNDITVIEIVMGQYRTDLRELEKNPK